MWGDEYNPIYALVWLILFMVAIRVVIYFFCRMLDKEARERERNNT